MTISATDIVVPVCSKIPLLYLLTQKVAQKFGYVLGIKKREGASQTYDTPSLFYIFFFRDFLKNLIFTYQ